MNIYLAKNQQKHGPYTADEVRARVASGTFTETDLGWHEGLASWQPLSRLLASLTSESEGPPPVLRKSSGLAKASFIMALVGFAFWLVLIAAAAVGVSRGAGDTSSWMVILGLLMFVVFIANLVGFILGAVALPKTIANKWMAVAGVTANCSELLGVLFLLLLGLTRK